MDKNEFLQMIEEQRFQDLEKRWAESLEASDSVVEDYFSIVKELRHRKEKERAKALTQMVYDSMVKKQNWPGRLAVLKEIARMEPIDRMKVEIREALEQIYSKDSSLAVLLKHYKYDAIVNPDDLVDKARKIERWLLCDKGKVVYEPRYGIGRVRENSLNLGIVRVDFEQKKDVSLEVDDPEMIPIPEGHLFYRKLHAPGVLSEEAEKEPGPFLGRVLEAFQRPLKVSELKDFMSSILPEGRWTSWWNAAKKHPRLLATGKGVSAVYSWQASAMEAEDLLRAEFDRADLAGKMDIARQAASRKSAIAAQLEQSLVDLARKAYEQKDFVGALQLIDFFSKSPAFQQAAGYTLEDIINQSNPIVLLKSLSEGRNDSIKERVVAEIPTLFPDRWKSLLLDAFLREDSGKVSSEIFRLLEGEYMPELEAAMDKVILQPHLYAPAFCWMCQAGSEELGEESPVYQRMDGKFLLQLLRNLDEREFTPFRNRIKTAMEKGLLLNILKKPMEKEVAAKAVSLLDHNSAIEDYRRARFKSVILSRIPEAKKKEDLIFTTVEALERKKKELDHLINIELPANRKAVGEAAAHGDLRENAEYKAARERQEYLITRLEQLQRDIARSRLLDPAQIDCKEIRPGAKVLLKQPSGKEWTVTILGLWDSNPEEGIYSYQSGIALALLGKVPAESVEVNNETWTIEKIEPWK